MLVSTGSLKQSGCHQMSHSNEQTATRLE